ncbi:MAG: outer membrane beta-barrel domain-containing protein [Pseudomonadota bacterium]
MTRCQQHRLVSILALGYFSTILSNGAAADEEQDVTVIEPNKTVNEVKSAAIDTEKFQVGAYVGSLAVEDFSSSTVFGASVTYHVNPRIIAQLNYGTTDVGRATFEDVVSGDFLSDDAEIFEYYSVAAGFNVFRGRSFINKNIKFNSDIFLTLGVGQVSFANNDEFSARIGTSYRVVVTDWLTWNLDFHNHLFERNFLEENKLTQNLEITTGFNLLF